MNTTIRIDMDNAKVLIIPDLHLRAVTFQGRYNYPEEVLYYLKELLKITIEQEVDIVIFLGDIFDNHFTEKGALQYYNRVCSVLRNFKAKLFTLMGNHELHNYNTSPFFYITNLLSDRITADLEYLSFKPICNNLLLTAPDTLLINNKIRFEFFHYSDVNKNYGLNGDNDTINIGLFHDSILSSKARAYIKSIVGDQCFYEMKFHFKMIEVYDNLFSNFEYACIGDIHTRIGEFKIGPCLVDIPGSLGRTQYAIVQKHTMVDLPVFTICGENVAKSSIPFNLYSIEDSYKVDLLEANKNIRLDKKALDKALTRVKTSNDILKDIDVLKIDKNIKDIMTSSLDGLPVLKSIELIDDYFKLNKHL